MTNQFEPRFSSFDEPNEPGPPTYALPLPDWDHMVALANHLGQREAEMPLQRRMNFWLEDANS